MKKILLATLAAFLSVGVYSQTILNEGFDGTSIPDGWTKTSANSTGWRFGSPSSLSSSYVTFPSHDGNCAASNDDALGSTGNTSNDRLISPVLDLSSLNNPALIFDSFIKGNFGSTGTVLISTDGGVTTSVLSAISPADTWQDNSISLASYATETEVQIIFRHTDNGSWADGLAIDNVVVFSMQENNASFTAITSSQYGLINAQIAVTGILKNMGSNNITSANISWTAGSQSGSALMEGLNIAPFESYEFTHPDMLTVGSEEIELEVTINSVNEVEESQIIDSVRTITILPLLFSPVRKVFIEEATGTWCGWCPRGAVKMDYMDATYPNSIEVAVHNGDPMKNTTYDNGIGSQIGGYPSGLVDRAYGDVDPLDFEAAYLDRKDVQAIVSVAVETAYEVSTRELTATIIATFATNMTNANYRINSVLVEDNVTGTGSGWGQSNYYSGGGSGSMGGYENLPPTVPASQMVYRHVGRQIFGGWNGTPNSIPSTIVAGEEYVYTYTFTVPANYDDSELSVVGLVIDQGNGQIMNAEESDQILSAPAIAQHGFDFNIYPNPAISESNISLNIEKPGFVTYAIYDLSGKRVAFESKGQLSPGEYTESINLAKLNSGLYFVTVTINDNQVTRKLAVE